MSISLFVYGCLKSLPAGGVWKGQVSVLRWVAAECRRPTLEPGHIRGGCGVLCRSRGRGGEGRATAKIPHQEKKITKGAGKHKR